MVSGRCMWALLVLVSVSVVGLPDSFHGELGRRQSLGWLDECRHHRSVVLVSAERSETIASRFEGAFRLVASGARLSISTGLGLQGSCLARN
ncbi:hypothetical protein Bca4012_067252 [Brassica carinata]